MTKEFETTLIDIAKEMSWEEFVVYLIQHKDEVKITWVEIADITNQIYNLHYSESFYRKNYKDIALSDTDIENENIFNDIRDSILELKKERIKLSDERTQNNAYIRRLSREETIKEIARDAADKMSKEKLLVYNKPKKSTIAGKNEGILMLSDWHYGVECLNYWNEYSPEVARRRVAQLKDKVIENCIKNNICRLRVLNLADLIAGRIHLTIRLESRIDVITQIMEVSEILAEFLADISHLFPVDYYSCLDNHSRVEPSKSDSLDLESLCRITDWYLKDRLKDFPVTIHDNKFGEDIITFNCKGYSILGVHGDKDRPTQIIDSISRMTQEHFDLICTAHLHHFSCDEKNNTVVVCNGAVLGTDTYAKNLRLSSKPSQNLIIVTDDSVCEAIYRILLV